MAKTDPKSGTKARRKKGGIRVPSDEVPRRSKEASAEEIDVSDVHAIAESSSDSDLQSWDAGASLSGDTIRTHERVAKSSDSQPPPNGAPNGAAPDAAPDAAKGAAPAAPPEERVQTVTLSDQDLVEVTDIDAPSAADTDVEEDDDDDVPVDEGAPISDTEPMARLDEVEPSHRPSPPPAPASLNVAGSSPPLPRNWCDDVFNEDYLRTLPFLTPLATQTEANFVIDSLGVEPSGQVLDLGCGYGRHAMELTARGYHVAGLDNSLPLLLRGAEEAQRRGLTIHFVHGDMREIKFEAQFDGAYCLFNSFGYFDDDANRKTLANVARALKPGAKFLIDVLNRDYLTVDLPTRVWWEGDGCVVLEEVDFNYFSSRLVSSRSLVFDDGRQVEQEISIRAYSLHELGKLLHAVGFRVTEISGSMATRGRFFGAQSRDLVILAERR